MNSSCLGWRPDRPGIDKPGHHLLMSVKLAGAFPELPQPSLFDFRGVRIDQGQAGACVAFFLTRCIQLYQDAHGISAPLASPRQLYFDGRREEWAGVAPEMVPPLEDTGTEPRLMMSATQALGYVPWDLCPYTDDPKLINEQPAPELYQRAFDCSGLDYARIQLVGEQAVAQTAQSLRARLPVGFGMKVDRAFMRNTGERITSINPDDLVGGHMLAVLAVLTPELIKVFRSLLPSTAQPGDLLFDNWWGNGDAWGNDLGLGVLSGAVYGSSVVSDRYIVRAAPALKVAA